MPKQQHNVFDKIFEFYLDPGNFARRVVIRNAVYGANIWTRIRSALTSLVGNFWRIIESWNIKKGNWSDSIWVVVGSRNQEASLSFLISQPGFSLMASNAYQPLNNAGRIRWWHRPKVWYLPRYLPFLWRVFRSSPLNFSRVFHHLLHGVGCLENHRISLRKHQPRAIIISNEDLPFFRALIIAARELSIPTVYLQHASVIADFPSLLSDLSLLDGQDALDKYRSGGKSVYGAVNLVGSPKYDQFAEKVNVSTSLTRLGIPYGFYDLPEKVEALVIALRHQFPTLLMTLRKHPRDDRSDAFKQLPTEVNWSDSREENVYDFLAQQDAIIASDSAVHLEATLLNVSSYYYPGLSTTGEVVDIYGFVKNGLVPVCTSLEELFQELQQIQQHRPAVRKKAAYYIGNLNTPFDGRSQELSLRAIKELLTNWPAKNV